MIYQIKTRKNIRTEGLRKGKKFLSPFVLAPLEASISSYDNALREKISELEMSLQDEITNLIGDTNVEPTDLERRVMEYKGQLIGLLYQPIRGNFE